MCALVDGRAEEVRARARAEAGLDLTAASSTTAPVSTHHPILFVAHDAKGGAWQFLCGTTNEAGTRASSPPELRSRWTRPWRGSPTRPPADRRASPWVRRGGAASAESAPGERRSIAREADLEARHRRRP